MNPASPAPSLTGRPLVLMLTARGDETDQIVGLEVGADDYLSKDSSTRQLLARLHAVTRRAAATSAPAAAKDETPLAKEIVVAELRINLDARRVTLADRPVVLTPGGVRHPRGVGQSQGPGQDARSPLEEVREREYEVFDRAIDVQVSNLRRKLGDDPKNPRFVRTVRSAGYMFVDPDAGS